MTIKRGKAAVLCVMLVVGALFLTACETHYALYTKKFSRQETVDLHRKLIENTSQAAFVTSAAASLCGAFKFGGPWLVGGCAVYVTANAARARDVLIMAYQRGQCFRLEYLVPKPRYVITNTPSYWSMASASCWVTPGGSGSGGGSW